MIIAFAASGLTLLFTGNFFFALIVFVGVATYFWQKRKKADELPAGRQENPESFFVPASSSSNSSSRGGASATAEDSESYTIKVTVGLSDSGYRTSTSYGGARGRGELVWAGPGESISVGGHELRDPLTYWASEAPKVDEASCIDRKLPVGKPMQEAPGALGYWPSYARISPSQRANYLAWLAGNRRAPLDDIGYAFIFFYGLERRALVEGKDFDLIFAETNRLLDTYTHSGSFHGYLSRFLGYLTAKMGLEDPHGARMKWLIEAPHASLKPDNLALLLAWYHKHSKPIPADLAMFIASQDARSSRSVVVDRVPEQFKALFTTKYQARFAQGLLLKAGKSESLVQYRPASSSLMYGNLITPIRVPNILATSSQFKPLVEIWQECIEELRSFARKANSLSDAPSREAFEALPEALRADSDHPDREKWEAIAAEYVDEQGYCLVPINRLAAAQDIECRSKLTAKQSQAIATTAQFVGFCMEPDARVTGRNYGWDDKVALFRPQEKPGVPDGNRYKAAAVMLELGMAIAAADGVIDQDELTFIEKFMEEKFLLEPSENRRLRALLKVLTEQPSTAAAVGKRLQGVLAEEQRETVARFLVGVAAANDGLHKKEITALKTAYKALGVDESKLTALLEGMRRADAELTEVRTNGPEGRQGEAIPPQVGTERTSDTLVLDEDLLRKIMAETAEVATILGAAMGEEEEPATSPAAPATAVAVVSDARFDGLDAKYQRVLAQLLEKDAWAKSEFDELVRQHSLMPSGVIEALNEWSDEHFGDFLIEEGDPLTVQAHLLKEAA
jgi:uncharacterized tellurite resistance protein B-like protein